MDNKLYIPYGIVIEKEILFGFGKKQFRQFAIGVLIAAALSGIVFLITLTAIAAIVTAVLGIAAAFIATRKETYSQSIVAILGNMLAYKKSQQKYRYIYKDY